MSDDSPFDFAEALESSLTPADDDLSTVAALTRQLVAKRREVSDLENRLLLADRELRALTEDALPRALTACNGMTKFELGDGSVTALKEAYRCGNLNFDDHPEGARYIDENAPDLIRNVLTVTLNAEDDEVADEIVEFLANHRAANRLGIERKRFVLWQTLAAYVGSRMAHGDDVPLKDLGVHYQQFVDVTQKGTQKFKRLWQRRK